MPDEEYYLVSRSDMEDVADAIREAGGTSDDLEWKSGWISAIEALAGGGTSWSTLADQNVTIMSSSPNYFVITSFTSAFGASETYRVTWGSGGTEFICRTLPDNTGTSYDGYLIGNPGVVGGTDDGSGAPFLIYRDSSTRLVCATSTSAGTLHLTLEKQVPAGGGASNCVTGTFKGTSTGAAIDVTLDYSGTGYPVAVVIYPAEGPYNSGTGTFYNSTQRYASQMYFVLKSEATTAPSYESTGSKNYGTIMNRYKNSTSNATSYNAAASSGANTYQDIAATSGSTSIVKIRTAKKMSVFIASNSYGFLANIDYKYWVLYSS